MFGKRERMNRDCVNSEFNTCPRGFESGRGNGNRDGSGRRDGGRGLGQGQGRGENNGRGLGLGNRGESGRGRGNGFGGEIGCRLGRRKTARNICGAPVSTYFKPNGIAVTDLEVVHLELDEFEALRLKNVEDFDQTEASKKMKISQSTFARILDSAYKKVSTALINGNAIEIEK